VGLPFILVMCLVGSFCLSPLAVYLLWLAQITRRRRPTILAGSWDFVGLLIGLSGFILFGGALVLSILQTNFRYWMRGNFEGLRSAWIQERVTWILLAAMYLILVVGGITLTLLSRRRSLVMYNIDPDVLETTLFEVFEQMNRPVERRGNVWFGAMGVPLFELERFSRGRTVTLRWVSEDRLLYQELERQLRETARTFAADYNPASDWLMAAAVGAGCSTLACFGLLIYAMRVMLH
jgi:hypothetical protein